MGIEPTRLAWKARILPLNYTRISATVDILSQYLNFVNSKFEIFGKITNIILKIESALRKVKPRPNFFEPRFNSYCDSSIIKDKITAQRDIR